MNTRAYLHSHLHRSPISGNQEVSAFGEQNRGDDWRVNCVDDKDVWLRDSKIRLSHGETNLFLSSSKKLVFQQVNF
jgi:dolichyl-phosphate-mannose--protein O-mannosyl transferase